MSKIIRLTNSSEPIAHLCKNDKRLDALIKLIGPIEYTLYDDNPYEFIVHEIVEQMLSKKAASSIFERLLNKCGGEVTALAINSLSENEIKTIGTSRQKASYIRNLTNAVLSGNLEFNDLPELTDKEIIKKLTAIKGIGNWTAKMYLIFVLDRQDVLPYEDGAFIQSYKWLYNEDIVNISELKENCKKWSPYSSIAARYLYRALDGGHTKSSLPIKL